MRGHLLAAATIPILVPGGSAGAPAALSPSTPPSPVIAISAPVAVPHAGTHLSAPISLDLPTLHVHAPIQPVEVHGGRLDVPSDPRVVGWWAAGGTVGETGAALVLDGHIDSAAAGPGALFRLATLGPGDLVTVTTADGTRHTWRVESMRSYPKPALPSELFLPTTSPRMVVISCGGHFDHSTRQYENNIVVTARPV